MLTFEPLGIPPGADPLEVMRLTSLNARGSEVIFLCWSPNNGWGGVRGVHVLPGEPRPAPAQQLAIVGDCHILAVHPTEHIRIRGGNSD